MDLRVYNWRMGKVECCRCQAIAISDPWLQPWWNQAQTELNWRDIPKWIQLLTIEQQETHLIIKLPEQLKMESKVWTKHSIPSWVQHIAHWKKHFSNCLIWTNNKNISSTSLSKDWEKRHSNQNRSLLHHTEIQKYLPHLLDSKAVQRTRTIRFLIRWRTQ